MRAFLGAWGSGKIHLEKRTGDVGDAKLVFEQDLLRFGDLCGVKLSYVLPPHTAKLNPGETEIIRRNGAGVIEVGRDFVVDHGETEGTGGGHGLELGCHEPRDSGSRDKSAT